jgi:hypothetical protein
MSSRGLLVVSALLAACSGGSKPPVGKPCLMNSECNNPLSCTFGKCHDQCREARDCQPGQLCVRAVGGQVCVLEMEEKCGLNSMCPDGLYCAKDLKCRNQCETAKDCATATQQCVEGTNGTMPTKVCAEPEDLAGGALKLPTGPFGSGDGGGAETSAPTDGGGARDAGADAPPPPAGFEFAPSNVPPSALAGAGGAVLFDGSNCNMVDVAVNTDSGQVNGCQGMLKVAKAMQSDGTMVALLVANRIRIDPTITLQVTGQLPLVLVATEEVQIFGKIVAAAAKNRSVAGGFPGISDAVGNGPGGGKKDPAGTAVSGGGGSYCGVGGKGAGGGAGGMRYSTPEIVPLMGGSSGASSGATQPSGAGGGAVQVVAGRAVTIAASGVIHVGGGGGSPFSGGGSGGAILLEAPSVTVLGTLAANGGAGAGPDATPDDQPVTAVNGGRGSGGTMLDGTDGMKAFNGDGGGGGGAGVIRINSRPGMTMIGQTARLSPAVGTACMTQGPLK